MRELHCTLFLLLVFSLLSFSIQLGITVDETTIFLNNKEISCLTIKESIPRSPAYQLRKDDVLLSMKLLKGVSVFSLEDIDNHQIFDGLTVADVLRIRNQATLEDSISVVLLRNDKLKQMNFPLDPAPPQKPFITLNTDLHTSEIRDIAVNKAKEILVSVSYDKTLKIWDTQTLSLSHTIRFPVEPGNSGKLYSVAISPDGSEIACGAYGGNWEKSDVIYILDVQNLTIKKVIRGLENIPTHLNYSPDGKYLLAAIRNHCEFAIFDTRDYSRINAFYGHYKGASHAAFSPDGQTIISVGTDSVLRLFDFKDGKITLKAEKSYNTINVKPYTAVFSPDGKKIGVGFLNGEYVEILEAKTLSLLKQPVVFEEENTEAWIHTLCWSPDGQTLYGGVYSRRPALIIWKNNQLTQSNRIFLESSPLDLATLEDKVYFCTEFQTIGFYDAASKEVVYHKSQSLDFTDAYLDFYCSADGSIIKIPFGIDDKPVFYDMRLPGLTDQIPEGTTMIQPVTYSEQMAIKNWRNAAETILNGKRLGIKEGELSRTLSIDPLTGHFTIGTDWYLYHFDQNGDLIWTVPVNSTVCALNTVKNGEWIIAILSNGTFEWYESKTGVKHASLYITKEKEWLFWTPDNDYISSPETIDWFGWQKNRDKNATAILIPQNTFQQKDPMEHIPDSFYHSTIEKTVVEKGSKRKDLYILSCAVETYENEQFENLSFAIDDAKAITTLFQNPEWFDVENINLHELYGDELNQETLLAAFEQLKNEMHREDILILFFAGHGFYKQEEGIERFYLKYPGNNDNGLSLDALYKQLKLLPNQNTLIITDSCYSGAITDYFASMFIKNTANKSVEQKDISVLVSAQAWMKSPEITELGHGLFTYNLLTLISSRERFNIEVLFKEFPKEMAKSSERYLEEVILPAFFISNSFTNWCGIIALYE